MSDTWTLHARGPVPVGPERYPSPRRLRRTLAFVIDAGLHLGAAVLADSVGGAVLPPEDSMVALAVAVGTWMLLSFVHRTVVQSIYHVTLGKWVLGLCVIRPADGRWPTFGALVWCWVLGFVAILFQNTPTEGKDGFPLVVRRRDVHR
ncbi:RDD family protein [Rhodococcus sp. T2V]|uniref:RDD family protein n=1 Tax=Rhodococcus sp. T2V TaxID=3034164 RepID=UPI0023E298EC|nr:RDD family protein [Rhodococcus sp. T2V]MDF3304907.1 RDD family protein [Rhodococcus sp. T2V]